MIRTINGMGTRDRRYFAEYYEEVKRRIFGNPNWEKLAIQAVKTPKVKFVIDKDFDFAASFSAYDFFVELSQQFGSVIYPIEFQGPKINLTLSFDYTHDYLVRDFRRLMLSSNIYHQIFRRHSVSMISVADFPQVSEADYAENPDIVRNVFKADPVGRPQPYLSTPISPTL